MPRARFDPYAAYLLAGALGGLGRSLAAWMVERGARHLVFLSRSGIAKPEAAGTVQELLNAGADPEVIRCDLTDRKALLSAVEKISETRQIKGVIHAAMVEGVSGSSLRFIPRPGLADNVGSRTHYSVMPPGTRYKAYLLPKSRVPLIFTMPQRNSRSTSSL